jgi:ketosteroid isomerase-like protein
MRHALLAAVLTVPVPALSAETPPSLAAEVEKGVAAYNAQSIAYYEDALATDAVYIAEDGAVFVGKERVLRLFARIFGRPTPPRVAVTDVATGGKGEVGWARFKWTLTSGTDSRQGVTTTLFIRAGDAWQVVQIQNTPSGHAMAAPSPAASPAASPKH